MSRPGRGRLAWASALGLIVIRATLAEAGEGAGLADAQQALATGDGATAERLFRGYVAEHPGSIDAHLGLARSLHAQDRERDAVAALLQTAREWIEAGELGSSERLLEEAVSLAPDSSQAHAQLGRARALLRKFRSAEEPLRRAVDLGRQDLRTLLYLGSTLWENGNLAEAESVLRQAVAVGNRAVLAVHQLARLLLWQGRFEEAAVLMAEAAARSPAASDIQLGLAQALAGAGQNDAAVAAFGRVCELLPEHSQARYGLALALARSGDRQGAREQMLIYRRLYEEDQERTRRQGLERARLDHGHDLLRAGELEQAIEHLRSLPPGPDVLAALAAAHSTAGEHRQAVELLERAVSSAPERRDLHSALLEARLAALKSP